MFKELIKGCMPKRGTKFSACVDVFASEDITISAGETELVGLGVCIDSKELKRVVIEDFKGYGNSTNWGAVFDGKAEKEHDKIFKTFLHSHYLQLTLRSSLATKGLMLANGVGIIDLDYKDEFKMIIYNPLKAHKGVAYSQKNNNKRALMVDADTDVQMKKGDKIGQITLLEHKSYLFGIESDAERDGGFDSTDEKRD